MVLIRGQYPIQAPGQFLPSRTLSFSLLTASLGRHNNDTGIRAGDRRPDTDRPHAGENEIANLVKR